MSLKVKTLVSNLPQKSMKQKQRQQQKIKRTVFLESWKPALKYIKEEIDEKFKKMYRIRSPNFANK